MGLKISSLGSGSKGNCFLIQSEKTRILIDLGIAISTINSSLAEKNILLSDIDGVLITHDHIDHIRSLPQISQRLPVYINFPSYKAMRNPPSDVINFDNLPFSIGEMEITPFPVSHDAPFTVGFSIEANGDKLTYATDIGEISKEFVACCKDASSVVIESNHDVELLKNGRYPAYLKKRILSKYGHLSNDDCAKTVRILADKGVKNFILSHLSEENNLPELAYWTTADVLIKDGAKLQESLNVFIAKQREMLDFT